MSESNQNSVDFYINLCLVYLAFTLAVDKELLRIEMFHNCSKRVSAA